MKFKPTLKTKAEESKIIRLKIDIAQLDVSALKALMTLMHELDRIKPKSKSEKIDKY